jgi:molybdopterin synthase catalytic subunit
MSPRMHISVQDQPLSVDAAVAYVKHPGCGAVVVMIGCVRDHKRLNDGVDGGGIVTVEKLEYEAYADMAQKVIAQIAADTAAQYPGTRLSVQHRVGSLDVGDLAVVCAASAPHRKEAFAACAMLIDRLKEDAPIWKREHGKDGVTWVGLGP